MPSEAWVDDDGADWDRFEQRTGMDLEDAIILVRRTLRRYYRGDEHATDDAVQETLLALVRRTPKPPGHSARGWVHRTAVNMAIDLGRAEQTRRGHEDEFGRRELREPAPDAGSSAVENLLSAELRALVQEAIASLPSAISREVLGLFFDPETGGFDAVSTAEAAARLGVRTGTVKSRKNAALRQLKARLEELRDQRADGDGDA